MYRTIRQAIHLGVAMSSDWVEARVSFYKRFPHDLSRDPVKYGPDSFIVVEALDDEITLPVRKFYLSDIHVPRYQWDLDRFVMQMQSKYPDEALPVLTITLSPSCFDYEAPDYGPVRDRRYHHVLSALETLLTDGAGG